MEPVKKIAILLFDNFTALDVVGPYEILSRIPDSKICMVAKEKGLYKNSKGLQINADYTLTEIKSPEILVIPGGFGIDAIVNDKGILEWVNNAYTYSQWTISICSGSILLAASGILNGKKATTIWTRKDQLREYGAIVLDKRYVLDGKIISSAGVSAGIDMSLYLISLMVNDDFAKTVQLAIEYDPKPPFDCGSPDKAPKEIVNRIKQIKP